MITTFRSKRLASYWTRADASKVPAGLERRRQQFQTLHAAGRLQEITLPGWHFHVLSGPGAGRYSLRVNANWRITFGWENGNAIAVDFEDYH